jgi:carbonic anhydrase
MTSKPPQSTEDLLQRNRSWANQIIKDRPYFFSHLAKQQDPKFMWIGCADSRVPANQITGLEPGEVFVHRNIANLMVHSDLNALSTLQFAVEHLQVTHIMVVGHYGCAGVAAALNNTRVGLADNWIQHIQDIKRRHAWLSEKIPTQDQLDTLCELNVIEQVGNVVRSTVLQDAWQRQQNVSVHGWIYGLQDGLLNDLQMTINIDNYMHLNEKLSTRIATYL